MRAWQVRCRFLKLCDQSSVHTCVFVNHNVYLFIASELMTPLSQQVQTPRDPPQSIAVTTDMADPPKTASDEAVLSATSVAGTTRGCLYFECFHPQHRPRNTSKPARHRSSSSMPSSGSSRCPPLPTSPTAAFATPLVQWANTFLLPHPPMSHEHRP